MWSGLSCRGSVMALRESVGLFFVVSATALAGAGESARADEAYLCGPDKLVYVKASELELKKKTDPCIAAYYGLTIDVSSAPDRASVQNDASNATPAGPASVAMKASVGLEPAVPAKPAHVRQAALVPAHAAPGTDYRNVRVINAASDAEQWFYHAR